MSLSTQTVPTVAGLSGTAATAISDNPIIVIAGALMTFYGLIMAAVSVYKYYKGTHENHSIANTEAVVMDVAREVRKLSADVKRIERNSLTLFDDESEGDLEAPSYFDKSRIDDNQQNQTNQQKES